MTLVKLKTLAIPSIGKNAERSQLSFTVNGNINWSFSNFEEKLGIF